jgi:hypothetical protein
MRLDISVIVQQIVRHAHNPSATYEWVVAREALVQILTDLETRADDPSLNKLRKLIQRGDQEFLKTRPLTLVGGSQGNEE